MSQVKRAESTSAFGQLLKRWRAARGLSQLALAVEAEVSSRHLSFVETGRSQPSRELVIQLAEALEIPLRERNQLLLAAGFAPLYRETGLDAPEMDHYRHVIEMILTGYEPFGAVALDRNWEILKANDAYWRAMAALGIDQAPEAAGNILKLLFSPHGLRPHIANWDEVAYHLVQRVHREAIDQGDDSRARELLDTLLRSEEVPPPWRLLDVQKPLELMVPVHLRVGDADLRMLTTITTLGTPLDVTLQELRIEAFLPADAPSEALMREMARAP